jgi:preprotein translocase subunit SecD
MEEDVRARLRQADPQIRIGEISSKDGTVSFMVADPAQVDAAREQLQPLTRAPG